MEKYKKKVRHIFPTFLIIAVLTNLIWSLINWFFTIENEVIDVKEEILTFWIPFVIPWIPLLIWLRPKLKILTFKIPKKRFFSSQEIIERSRFLFLFISWIIIAGLISVSQKYLLSETGDVKKITKIEEINTCEKVRFYEISDFDINFNNGKAFTNFWYGKSTLYIDIYFVYPFESGNSSISVLYGHKFHKPIYKKKKETDKAAEQQLFYSDCLKQIDNLDISSIKYFEKVENNRDRNFFMRAADLIENKSAHQRIVLEPKFESYSKRNNKYIHGLLFILLFGSGLLLLLLEWPGLSEHEYKKQTKYK